MNNGEGDPLNNLEASSRKARISWDAPQELRPLWESFLQPQATVVNGGACGRHFGILHLTC